MGKLVNSSSISVPILFLCTCFISTLIFLHQTQTSPPSLRASATSLCISCNNLLATLTLLEKILLAAWQNCYSLAGWGGSADDFRVANTINPDNHLQKKINTILNSVFLSPSPESVQQCFSVQFQVCRPVQPPSLGSIQALYPPLTKIKFRLISSLILSSWILYQKFEQCDDEEPSQVLHRPPVQAACLALRLPPLSKRR